MYILVTGNSGGAGAALTPEQEVPAGLVNGVNVTYTLANTPANDENLLLFLDGVLQRQPTDYSIAGTTITMVTAPALGQELYAKYER